MASRFNLILVMATAAKREAVKIGKTPSDILESIFIGRFSSELTEGKTLVSTSENGGVATFAIPGDLSPAQVSALAHETIRWLQSVPDPDHPTEAELYPRRIKRVRASFNRSQI